MNLYNLTGLYKSNYRNDVETFFKECGELTKPSIDRSLLKRDYTEQFKIAYKPKVEVSIAVNYIHFVKKELSINPLSKATNDSSSNFFKVISNGCDEMKQMRLKMFQQRCNHPAFQQWLSTKISDLEKKQGENANTYWAQCAIECKKMYDLKEYTPNEDIQSELSKYTKEFNVKFADCVIFIMSYLGLLNSFRQSDRPTSQDVFNFLREAGYRFVSQPSANDIIVYLNEKNYPVHFGVFINPDTVVSKYAELGFFQNAPQNCCYGTSYIILSNSG